VLTNKMHRRIVKSNIPTVGGKLSNKKKLQIEDDTRTRIVTVANELFFSMEYNKVTLKEIAEKSGVTKGGIYHYFDSKDDLLVESLTHSFDAMMGNIETELFEQSTFEDVLKKWFNFRSHLDEYSGEKDAGYNMIFQAMYLLMIAIRKSDKVTSKIRAIYLSAIEELKNLIMAAQNSGEVRSDIEASVIAHQLLSIVEGGILVSIVIQDEDLRKTGDKMFEALWKQLKA